MTRRRYACVAIGCSAGGLDGLRALLPPLPSDYPLPILVVAHQPAGADGLLAEILNRECRLPAAEAEEKYPVLPGHVYVAPPDYHLLVEEDYSFTLSADPKVMNVRPAIDVLFESLVDAYGAGVIGVVLSGANGDGAAGLAAIRRAGGCALVQAPESASSSAMPEAALAQAGADHVLPPDQMASVLVALASQADAEAP